MAKFLSCVYTGPALNELHHHQCLCLVELASDYVGLLGDASYRPYLKGRADGVKRMCSHERSNKLQQSGRKPMGPCDLGKIVWWSLIWIWWGWGPNVFQHSLLRCDWLLMRDNLCWSWGTIYLLCPVIRMVTKYQHKRYSCPNIIWKPPKSMKTMQV